MLGLFVACGGSTPPAEPPSEPEPIAETPPPVAPAPEPTEDEAAAEGEGDTKPAASEPEFKEGMSVEEAIAAVPQGAPRENVEQEALSQPLLDSKVYAPCKPKPNAHFKLKVAVWDGRAVGIDVTTQPENEQLAQCVKQQVSQLSWKDKVKSLNVVEFSY